MGKQLIKSSKLIGGTRTRRIKQNTVSTSNKAHNRKLPQSVVKAVLLFSSGERTTEKYWRDLGSEYGWDTEAKIKREAKLHQRYEREMIKELDSAKYVFDTNELKIIGTGKTGRCLDNAIRANRNDPDMKIYRGLVITETTKKTGKRRCATLEHFWNVKDGVVYEYTDIGYRKNAILYYAGNPITKKEAENQRASDEWK